MLLGESLMLHISYDDLEQLLIEKKGYDAKKAKKSMYQMRIFLRSLVFTFLITVILMWFRCFKEAVVVMIILKCYRSYSGGIHIKSYMVCFVCSLLVVGGIIAFEKCLVITLEEELFIWGIGIYLWFRYVPQGSSVRPIRNALEKKRMKRSFLIVMVITASIRFFNHGIYELCLYSMFVTLLLITPLSYRIFKVRHDRIEEGCKLE